MRMGGVRSLLLDVKPEYCFVLRSGQRLKNLRELAEVLENISDDEFRHHVNLEKNDFSNWIRDVIKDGKLAGDVYQAKNKGELLKKIKKGINLAENSGVRKKTEAKKVRAPHKKRKGNDIKERKAYIIKKRKVRKPHRTRPAPKIKKRKATSRAVVRSSVKIKKPKARKTGRHISKWLSRIRTSPLKVIVEVIKWLGKT